MTADSLVIAVMILGFLSFGYATGEFAVTKERLSVYALTVHIDNPKGYGEGEDPRKYDPRLRPPVDEARELAIDERNGMKVRLVLSLLLALADVELAEIHRIRRRRLRYLDRSDSTRSRSLHRTRKGSPAREQQGEGVRSISPIRHRPPHFRGLQWFVASLPTW